MTLSSAFWSTIESCTQSILRTPIREKISNVLIGDVGCCFRCTMRFMGIRNIDIHAAVAPVTETTETTDPPSTSTLNPCPACLGLLQLDHRTIAQQAHQLYRQHPYILAQNVFGVSLRLPPTLPIRQRSISLLLENQLGIPMSPVEYFSRSTKSTDQPTTTDSTTHSNTPDNQQLPKPTEIKDIFKHLMILAYGQVSESTYDSNSPLTLALHMDHPETDLEFDFMTHIPHAKFSIKKARHKGRVVYRGASVEKIVQAVSVLSYNDYETHKMVPPVPIKTFAKVVSMQFEHTQIYVAGRYCKHERGISNSPWTIGQKRLTEHSVEELIGDHIDKFFSVSSHKFSSSGREDADVLMLGRGRPFYFELVNPHRAIATPQEMASLETLINTSSHTKISVRDLQLVTRDSTTIMKDSVATKSKSYRCLVEFSDPVPMDKLTEIGGMTDVMLMQQNPTRVPRRADIMREKCIETISFTPRTMETIAKAFDGENVSDEQGVKTVDVYMRTSAGTYVKEFVHGDNGRTTPCLALLVGVSEARVIELDVLEIHVDWPPECDRSVDSQQK